MPYLTHLLILVAIYASLAVSLDLLVGHTGMVSLAHGAFFGIGAYAVALLALHFGVPIWLGTLVGMAAAGASAGLVGFATASLRDDYFVIATFSLQLVFTNLCENLLFVTRGPMGISGIPSIAMFGIAASQQGILALGIAFLGVIWVIVRRLTESPFGRVLHAIREDDVLARSLGKNDRYFKSVAFAVSAAAAGGAGAIYATYTSYIEPSIFTITESILVLSMVIIGGAGRLWGPLLGAALLVLLPELLRLIGLPDTVASNLRQLFYGAALVGLAMLRPDGLAGRATNRGRVR